MLSNLFAFLLFSAHGRRTSHGIPSGLMSGAFSTSRATKRGFRLGHTGSVIDPGGQSGAASSGLSLLAADARSSRLVPTLSLPRRGALQRDDSSGRRA